MIQMFPLDRNLDVLLVALFVGAPLLAAFSVLLLFESIVERFPAVKRVLPNDRVSVESR